MGNEMKFRLWQTGDFSTSELEIATPHELFEMWCNYEGLTHYADSIINALRECGYNVEVPARKTEMYVVSIVEWNGDEVYSERHMYHRTFRGAVSEALNRVRRLRKYRGRTIRRIEKTWYTVDSSDDIRIYIEKRIMRD